MNKLQNILKKYFKGDPIIWGVMVMLAIISMLTVYSSTNALAYSRGVETNYFLFRHFIFLSLGFGVAWFIHTQHYDKFRYVTRFLMPIAIVLLLATLLFGETINGANRLLKIPIIGIQFQPSEIAKYVGVMFVAMHLGSKQTKDMPPQKAMLTIMFWLGIISALIITQNLSTAMLILGVTVAMMLVGRVPFKYVLGLGLVASTLFIGVVAVDLASDKIEIGRVTTWMGRVKPTFENWGIEMDAIKTAKASDPFQADMARVAVSTGGIFGKGPGNSEQKQILPHPYSDFLYAIIIEEGGMIMGIFVLLLYFILLYRTFKILSQTKSTFPAFLTIGLGMTIFLQAFIHMGVSVGLGPVTGQTLPLMSMGGTSIVITCIAFGMIQSVSRYSNPSETVNS